MRLVLVAVVSTLGLAAWLLLARQTAPRTHHATTPVVEQAASLVAPPTLPVGFNAAARVTAPQPEAEALLRQLEPLAVTDKPRALELALAADVRLPETGVMAEARRALIVTLLVDTQRMAEARGRAREFFRLYATSRYVPLLRGVTGLHARPTPRQMRDAR